MGSACDTFFSQVSHSFLNILLVLFTIQTFLSSQAFGSKNPACAGIYLQRGFLSMFNLFDMYKNLLAAFYIFGLTLLLWVAICLNLDPILAYMGQHPQVARLVILLLKVSLFFILNSRYCGDYLTAFIPGAIVSVNKLCKNKFGKRTKCPFFPVFLYVHNIEQVHPEPGYNQAFKLLITDI
jgi:hypothetical protein